MSDCQNLTHTVSTLVSSRHDWEATPLMVPTPTFWRAGLLERGPPNCPTYPPPYLTQTTVPGENGS